MLFSRDVDTDGDAAGVDYARSPDLNEQASINRDITDASAVDRLHELEFESVPELSDSRAHHSGVLPPASLVSPSQLPTWTLGHYFAARLMDEPIDVDWAGVTESRIREQLSATALPMIAADAHCRTAICRVEVAINSSTNPASYIDYFQRITSALEVVRAENSRFNQVAGAGFGDGEGAMLRGGSHRVWQVYLYRCPERVINVAGIGVFTVPECPDHME